MPFSFVQKRRLLLTLELVLVYFKLAFAYFVLLVVYLKCLLVSSRILYRENCEGKIDRRLVRKEIDIF